MHLNGAVLFVKDFPRMRDFYVALLQARPINKEWTNSYALFDLNGGKYLLHAIPEEYARDIKIASPPMTREGNPVKVIFAVENISSERSRLEAMGIATLQPTTQTPTKSCDGVDPEGNVFQIQEFPVEATSPLSEPHILVETSQWSILPPLVPSPPISRVILYVKDIQKVASFYQMFFGMKRTGSEEPGWLELKSPSGDCQIALHQASKAQKSGAAVKLVFGVKDVRAFREASVSRGLKFGPVHFARNGFGHEFANAKDPAGNSISISSRGMMAPPEK